MDPFPDSVITPSPGNHPSIVNFVKFGEVAPVLGRGPRWHDTGPFQDFITYVELTIKKGAKLSQTPMLR